MRLFVAIPLPEEVRKELLELEESIQGVKWQKESILHLTLRFIGSVDRAVSEKVQYRLSEINLDSFKINIDGLGYFPEQGSPRVLWAGVEKHPDLILLQKKVEEACVNAGLEADKRPYTPHITIAKVKRRNKSKEVKSFIDRYEHFQLKSIPVNKFILYRSELKKEGAIHTVLDTYVLN